MNVKEIPVFPLDIVVFPGEIIPLHIFEPRYRELIRELRQGRFDVFGVSPVLGKKLQRIGTVMVLTEVKTEYPDGRMDIEARALNRYLLEEYEEEMAGFLFPGGRVIDIPEPEGEAVMDNEPLKQKVADLFQLLKIREKMPVLSLPFHSYTWAPYIGLPIEKRYQLLKMNNEAERQTFIEEHVDGILPVLREAEAVKQKVQSNGHFHGFKPGEGSE